MQCAIVMGDKEINYKYSCVGPKNFFIHLGCSHLNRSKYNKKSNYIKARLGNFLESKLMLLKLLLDGHRKMIGNRQQRGLWWTRINCKHTMANRLKSNGWHNFKCCSLCLLNHYHKPCLLKKDGVRVLKLKIFSRNFSRYLIFFFW